MYRALDGQDGKEAQSGTLYGHGGKKIKNPKKEASTTRDPYRKQKIKRAKYLRQNPMPVPASKHGPTDAKPVNPRREGARHGPTI